jgi:hypothetical protein
MGRPATLPPAKAASLRAAGNGSKEKQMARKFILPCGKVVFISENPRKLKRFLENEFYAVDARFWVDKIKSADRTMVHDQPVDRLAHRIIHPRAHDLP